MRIFLLLAILIVGLTSTVAFAAPADSMIQEMTINNFHKAIREGGVSEIVAKELIYGIQQGFLFANLNLEMSNRPKLYCQPDHLALTVGQIIDILDRYTANHKKYIDNLPTESRILGIYLLPALQEAFPC